MSQESAKKFIERVQKDTNFKQQLSQTKTKEKASEFLEKNGFHFTHEEYRAAAKLAMGREVSDKELTQIAGGVSIIHAGG